MHPILEAMSQELTAGLPEPTHLARVALRLIVALLLGAAVGFNREKTGKPAGVRTHMLLSLGAALFVTTAVEYGMSVEGISRVAQGVATGIGFLGAGAILKISSHGEIKGLTTAAGIWVTAAVGVACGLGLLGAAILTIVLAWLTLAAMESVSTRIAPEHAHYNLKNKKDNGDVETED